VTPSTRSFVVTLVRVLVPVPVLVVAACDPPKPQPRPQATTSVATASPTQTVVNAKLGCIAAVRGGHALGGRSAPGFTSIAAARGKALVVHWRASAPQADAAEPAEEISSERVVLDGAAKPLGPMTPVADANAADAGPSPLTWASASTFGGELTSLSYGITRVPAAGCRDARVAWSSGEQAATTAASDTCKLATSFAGAGRGELAVLALNGPTAAESQRGKTSAIDAIVLSGGSTRTTRLHSLGAGGSDALAAALGVTWAAVAWRTGTDGAHELYLAGVDKAGVTTSPKPVSLDKGMVGAPALAFEGDTVHVVWAARRDDRSPYQLRWAKWDGKGAPTQAQTLSTRGGPAFAPAIAVQPGGRFVVAWTEGDEKAGVVKGGSSRVNILAAVLGADALSTPGVDARAPEVAVDGDTSYVVWHESADKARPEGLRATTLRCIE
jgi:hypothetical protein